MRFVALALVAGVGLIPTGARAQTKASLVPVVSDDQAEWAKERPPAYVGVGSSVSSDAHVNADLFVEGGMRVATTPIWVHGLVGSGAQTPIEDQGRFLEARGGIELSCSHRSAVCGFFGIDVGGELQTRQAPPGGDDGKLSGIIAVPRMGLDLGGDIVRVRASFDGRWFRYQSRNESVAGTSGGAGVSLALALRF
jgi:hypothetical protein